MRNKLLSLVILVMLLASAACAPKATATPAATEAPAAAVATEAPTEAPAPVELTVMAAASLTESFRDRNLQFRRITGFG